MKGESFRVPDRRQGALSFAHAAGVVFAAYALAIVFVFVGAQPIALVSGLSLDPDLLVFRLWSTIGQFLGFIVVALWYVANVDRDVLHVEQPRLRTLGWMAGGFVLLLVASTVVSILISMLGASPAQNQVIAIGEEQPVFLLYMIPIAFLLVGPGEELIFRGVVQGKLRQAFGVWPGILLSSALFGLVHWLALIGSDSGRFVYVFVAAVLGLVLGTVYEYSKNILVPIVIHGLWNAMLFAINWYVIVNEIQLPS